MERGPRRRVRAHLHRLVLALCSMGGTFLLVIGLMTWAGQGGFVELAADRAWLLVGQVLTTWFLLETAEPLRRQLGADARGGGEDGRDGSL